MTSVHVIYHHETDGWWADSPEIPGWTATAESIDELRELAQDGVRFALEDESVLVEHRLEGAFAHADITYDFVLGQTRVSSAARIAVPA